MILFMLNVKNSLRDFLRPFASNFLVSTGIAKGTEDEFSLVCSGASEHLAYLQSRFFSNDTVTVKRIGRRPIYMLQNMLTDFAPSLGAVILNRRLATEIRGPEDLIMPLWVDTRIDLAEEADYAKSKSVKADLRTIRKNELEWTISKSCSDLHIFYERFYIPTINASHGRAALLADRAERLKLFEAGKMELLQVKRGGKVIAAVTIDYRQKVPVLRDSGVLDGSSELKKFGVITALNLFSMDYLASKGYQSTGLGLSRSFLDDGVLAFKRKFRPIVRPTFDQCLLLRTGVLNPAIRTILSSSACFTWQSHELHRTYFLDAAANESSAGNSNSGSDWRFGVTGESTFDISGETIRLQTGPNNLAQVS